MGAGTDVPADRRTDDASDRVSLRRRVLRFVDERPVAAVAALALVGAVVQVLSRPPYLGFHPDQAIYLRGAFRLRHELLGGGAPPSIAAPPASAFGSFGPALPLLSLPFLAVAPRSLGAVMLIQPILYAATGVLVAAVTARVATGRAAFVAGAVALGAPASIILARSYLLSLGASAALCFAAYALLRSQRGANRRWMLLFGAATGALLLTRIASAAMLPGLVLAALFHVRRDRDGWRNLGLAALVAFVVAAPWWWSNRVGIYDYVTFYGYGEGSTPLGPSSPVLRLFLLTIPGLWLNLRLLLAFAAQVAIVVVVVRMVRRRRDLRTVLTATEERRSVVTLTIIVGTTLVALATSANMGDFFSYPAMMLGIAVVAAAAAQVGGRVVGACAAASLVAVAVNLALVGRVTFGEPDLRFGTEGDELLFGGVRAPMHVDAWARADDEVVRKVREIMGDAPFAQGVVGGSQIYNLNSIEASEVREGLNVVTAPAKLTPRYGRTPLLLVLIDVGAGNTADAPWPGQVNVTVPMAERAGWSVAARISLPDGGAVRILTHPDGLP